jgi:hypothetical protein
MQEPQVRFLPLAAKTVVCHTITYMVMGMLAYHFLHYAGTINNPCSGMRPTTSIWVMLGAPLQLFRGVLFAAVFFPLRTLLFGRRHGWLLMAWILVGVGILGTFAAPAGSLEGFIYTTTPFLIQVRGYLEIVTPRTVSAGPQACFAQGDTSSSIVVLWRDEKVDYSSLTRVSTM